MHINCTQAAEIQSSLSQDLLVERDEDCDKFASHLLQVRIALELLGSVRFDKSILSVKAAGIQSRSSQDLKVDRNLSAQHCDTNADPPSQVTLT